MRPCQGVGLLRFQVVFMKTLRRTPDYFILKIIVVRLPMIIFSGKIQQRQCYLNKREKGGNKWSLTFSTIHHNIVMQLIHIITGALSVINSGHSTSGVGHSCRYYEGNGGGGRGRHPFSEFHAEKFFSTVY